MSLASFSLTLKVGHGVCVCVCVYVCVCVCNCLEDWALSLFYFYCGLIFTADQQFGVG